MCIVFYIILNLKGMINHFNRQEQYYEKNYIQNIIFLSIYYACCVYKHMNLWNFQNFNLTENFILFFNLFVM